MGTLKPLVYEVNPLYTKQRRTFGTKGRKSDPVDAKLIAEVLTKKVSELPKITKAELSTRMINLKRLVWYYEEIKVQDHGLKTNCINCNGNRNCVRPSKSASRFPSLSSRSKKS